MAHIIVKHSVSDPEKWKAGFENGSSMRKLAGSKSYQIFHLEEDPTAIVVLFEWDSPDNFRRFLNTPELKETMDEAGVIGKPEIYFLENVGDGTD